MVYSTNVKAGELQPTAERCAFIFEKYLLKKKLACERNIYLLFKSFIVNYFNPEKRRDMGSLM